jgi:hypothetical protein
MVARKDAIVTTDAEWLKDTRAQGVNVKVRTDFGTLHFTVRHDEQSRVTRIDWDTHDSDLTPDTQIGKLLRQCTKAMNDAIAAMNEDWSAKWDLQQIAKRRAVSEQTQQMIEEARAL